MAGRGILMPRVLEEIACRGFNSTLMKRVERLIQFFFFFFLCLNL